MKYAHINENNQLIGWYDSDLNAVMPEGALEVQESEWQSAININANFRDPQTGVFSVKEFTTAAQLEAARVAAIKTAAQMIIYAKYDQEDQYNIAYLAADNAERVAAVAWINKIRAISKAAVAENTKLNDIDWTM